MPLELATHSQLPMNSVQKRSTYKGTMEFSVRTRFDRIVWLLPGVADDSRPVVGEVTDPCAQPSVLPHPARPIVRLPRPARQPVGPLGLAPLRGGAGGQSSAARPAQPLMPGGQAGKPLAPRGGRSEEAQSIKGGWDSFRVSPA